MELGPKMAQGSRSRCIRIKGVSTTDTSSYALGHSQEELVRLGTQASVIDPMTRRTFEEAEVGRGMRVLDVACGPGYVSTLLADLVGEDGEIVGVDINPTMIATAESRIKDLGLHNVTFQVGDPSQMSFDRSFDAVVGRYILMFLPDPAAMVRGVAAHARKGGVVAFHEVAWYSATSYPPAPLYDKVCQWLIAACKYKDADPDMGVKLPATFSAAGLPAPLMHVESLIGSGQGLEPVRLSTELLKTMEEAAIGAGVATKEEIGIDTLYERVRGELLANHSTAVCRSEVGAWVRV